MAAQWDAVQAEQRQHSGQAGTTALCGPAAPSQVIKNQREAPWPHIGVGPESSLSSPLLSPLLSLLFLLSLLSLLSLLLLITSVPTPSSPTSAPGQRGRQRRASASCRETRSPTSLPQLRSWNCTLETLRGGSARYSVNKLYWKPAPSWPQAGPWGRYKLRSTLFTPGWRLPESKLLQGWVGVGRFGSRAMRTWEVLPIGGLWEAPPGTQFGLELCRVDLKSRVSPTLSRCPHPRPGGV